MEELFRRFSEAERACNQGESTADFEEPFVRLLQYINEHPELRNVAEGMFLSGLHARITPWELISFCMHELRWQGVRDAVLQRSRDAIDPRNQRVLSLIVKSFDDDWSERELYSYYSGS